MITVTGYLITFSTLYHTETEIVKYKYNLYPNNTRIVTELVITCGSSSPTEMAGVWDVPAVGGCRLIAADLVLPVWLAWWLGETPALPASAGGETSRWTVLGWPRSGAESGREEEWSSGGPRWRLWRPMAGHTALVKVSRTPGCPHSHGGWQSVGKDITNGTIWN